MTGRIVTVKVTAVETYGLHVTCEGVRGVILIPEISWQRVSHPSQHAQLGDELRCQVIHVAADDRGEVRFSGSIRQLHPEANPWRDPDVYAVGQEFDGVVARVTSYGVFVQHPRQAWALLHAADIPQGMQLTVGTCLGVVIVDSDPASQRIQVVLRQPHIDPTMEPR